MPFIVWKQEYAFTPDASAVNAGYSKFPTEEWALDFPASVVEEEERYPAIFRLALPVLASALLWGVIAAFLG